MRVTQEEFELIRKLVSAYAGLSLAPDKLYLAQSRLVPLLTRHSLASFAELIEQVQKPKQIRMRDEFVEAMVTNETSFNRDLHPFEALRSHILPRLVSNHLSRGKKLGIAQSKLRIWSAAASTGQEAFSIAMAIVDFIECARDTKISCDQFSILASDISESALEVARNGIYTELELARGVSPEQRSKFFVRNGKKWEVVSQLKRMVEFRRMNITQPHDLLGFDLVFCRNLLFYFDEPTRGLVCEKIISSLNTGGVLLIGSAEHLPGKWESRLCQEQIGRTTIYIKPQ